MRSNIWGSAEEKLEMSKKQWEVSKIDGNANPKKVEHSFGESSAKDLKGLPRIAAGTGWWNAPWSAGSVIIVYTLPYPSHRW